MRRFAPLALALIVAAFAVPAISAVIEYKDASGVLWGATVLGFINGSGQAQRVSATTPAPVSDNGLPTSVQGTLAVSTSSVAISSLTLVPGSGSFAMPPPNGGKITIKNHGDSAGNVRICWFGGTCTTSVGKILEPGASSSVRLTGSTSPSVIGDAAGNTISITE
jgi:hypothetical protein